MSEQEKNSGGGTDTSVVMVEQQSASRHKQPFRPVDMQEDATNESHHKRSKAPAVPFVAEDLKDNVNPESKERKDCERAMSSEKHSKHIVSKKVSLNKKRPSSPEMITLQALEVDVKPGTLSPTAQPIPKVSSLPSKAVELPAEEKIAEQKDDEGSIIEEIAELRTSTVAKDPETWEDIAVNNKKEVSWNEGDYLDKVQLENITKVQSCILERKSSIGPCYRTSKPFGRPSGISVCLSKRFDRNENDECQLDQTAIKICISKKCLINKNISTLDRRNEKTNAEKTKIKESCLTTLREQVANMGDKVKNIFA